MRALFYFSLFLSPTSTCPSYVFMYAVLVVTNSDSLVHRTQLQRPEARGDTARVHYRHAVWCVVGAGSDGREYIITRCLGSLTRDVRISPHHARDQRQRWQASTHPRKCTCSNVRGREWGGG